MGEQGFVSKIIAWILSHPYKTILSAFFLFILMGMGLTKLETDFSYRIWFDQDNSRLKYFDEFEQRFGSDELAVIAIHSSSGIFDKSTAELITQLTEDLWQTPEVIRVDSLTNFNWVHADGDEILVEPLIPDDEQLTTEFLLKRKEIAVNHPSIKNYLVNDLGDVAVIYAMLKPSFDGSPEYENVIKSIRNTLEKYKGNSDHIFYLSGNPVLNFAFKESTIEDSKNLLPMVLLITIVFLIFSFRKLSGVALPILIIFLTVTTSVSVAGLLGIKINNITSVVPQFMIAIAIAVTVHILASFFMFYRKGLSQGESIQQSAVKNFSPTLLTAISTAIGFFSFTLSPIPPISNMGIMAGFGTLFSWFFAYSILMPLLAILKITQPKSKEGEGDVHSATTFSLKASELIYDYKALIIIIFGGLSLGSFYLATQVEVNSDPFRYFDKQYSLSVATDFLEKKLGGAVGAEIIIESGAEEGIKDPEFLRKVEKYQNWLSHLPEVTKVVSIIDILKDMNQALNGGGRDKYKLPDSRELVAQQLFLYRMNLPQGMDINNRVSLKNDALRITAMWTVHDSKTGLVKSNLFESKAKELGLKAVVTGKMPLYHSNNEKVVSSFKTSISLAIVLVAVLLIIGFKSLKLGLISMIPNTIPLIIGAGMVKLFGQTLDIGTVIVGSVCLGIAVDDTIHFLAGFKKYTGMGESVKVAIAKVFTNTAPALITTTCVLVMAFATLGYATFIPNQNFGMFVAIILVAALVIDLIFLPALLMLFEAKHDVRDNSK